MLCQEEMEQAPLAWAPEVVVEWVLAGGEVEEGWVGHLLLAPVVVVYVRAADTVSHTLQASRVTSKAVQSVGRE